MADVTGGTLKADGCQEEAGWSREQGLRPPRAGLPAQIGPSLCLSGLFLPGLLAKLADLASSPS